MNINYYYQKLIIDNLEKEIKETKKKLNNKFNFNKEEDKKYLIKLQKLLNLNYKKYYIINNKEST